MLANKLRDLRKARGWSQTEFEQVLDCSQDQVSHYERDLTDPLRKVPTPRQLVLIFEMSGGELDPNYFVGVAPSDAGGRGPETAAASEVG